MVKLLQSDIEQYTVYALIIAILLMFMGKLLSRRRKDREKIDCLKEEMTVMREEVRKRNAVLDDRILFLEKVPLLLSLIKDGSQGISVKDLIKMIEHGFYVFLDDPNAFNSYISINGWNCWNTRASEEELLEISFFIARKPMRFGTSMIYIKFIGGVSIYGGINDKFEADYHSYNKKMEQLRDCRSKFPNYYLDHKKYFDSIENVLKALYKEKLLK